MKKLIVVPALLLACQDHNPVQPAPDLTPELALVQAPVGKGNIVKMVPFRDGGTWWYVAEGDPTPCQEFHGAFPVFVAWEGTGTRLGRFTGSETLCLDAFGRLVAYSNQWTTANGDQLFGYGSILGDPPVQMIYEPGVSWEISGVFFVGGTGRFHRASGSVRYVGDHSLGANVGGIYTGDGWISTVGSGK
jgi:hypothetical protein